MRSREWDGGECEGCVAGHLCECNCLLSATLPISDRKMNENLNRGRGRLSSGILKPGRWWPQDQLKPPVTFEPLSRVTGDSNEKNNDGEKLLAAATFVIKNSEESHSRFSIRNMMMGIVLSDGSDLLGAINLEGEKLLSRSCYLLDCLLFLLLVGAGSVGVGWWWVYGTELIGTCFLGKCSVES